MTWTGDGGVAEDPIEESSRDSDLGMDLADPELMDPVPRNIQSKHKLGWLTEDQLVIKITKYAQLSASDAIEAKYQPSPSISHSLSFT